MRTLVEMIKFKEPTGRLNRTLQRCVIFSILLICMGSIEAYMYFTTLMTYSKYVRNHTVLISNTDIFKIYFKHAVGRWVIEILFILLIVFVSELLTSLRDKKYNSFVRRLKQFNAFRSAVNQLVLCEKEIDSLLQAICDIATQSECFKVVCVVRPDEQGEASVLAFSGPEGCENGFPVSFHKVCDEKANSFTRAWHERRIIIDNTFDENCREEEKVWAKKYELSFHAVLPIYLDNKVWGLLSIYDDRVQKYFEDKFELLLNEIVRDISSLFTILYVRHIQVSLFNNRVVGVLLIKENVIQQANTYATEVLCTSLEGIINSSIEQFCFDRTDFQRILEVEQDLCSDECIKVPGVLINRQDGQLMIADFSGTRLSFPAEDLTLWAIENVTYRQLAEFFYKALIDVSDMILRAITEEEICSRVCVGLSYNTFFHTVWIGTCDRTEEKLVTIAASGDGISSIDQVSATTEEDRFFVPVQAWKQEKVFYRNDKTLSDDNHNETTYISHAWRSVLSAPIWRDGQLWGIMTFVSVYPNIFEEQTLIMCKRTASLIGYALEKLEHQRYYKDKQAQEALLARRDLLTGLPNRLALTEYLPQAFARARRYDTLVAVGVFDLDDFKQVNDIWGHAAGDDLLRELADRAQKTMRETDFIVRMGGDEFVIVFEGLSQTNFMLQITRALEHLHVIVETPFNVAENAQATVGMTMGVALFPTDGEDSDTLLRLADIAMYRSKKEKMIRQQWWYLASINEPIVQNNENEKKQEEICFEAYDSKAQAILTRFNVFLNELSQDFVKSFYDVFYEKDNYKRIFMFLSSRDITRLKSYQERYVRLLLSPIVTRKKIKRAAVKLGIMCFLSGIHAALLTEAYSLFRRLLISHLNKTLLRASDRYYILSIIETRLQDNKGTQLEMAYAVRQEYFERLCHLPDTLEEIVVTLRYLPGIQATVLFRMNAEGELVAERGEGLKGEELALLNSERYRPTLDENEKVGSSLAVLAWKTGRIQTSNAPTVAHWRDIALRLRIYSAVSVPILEKSGNVVAIINMYGRYPCQFETKFMQQFNQILQHYLLSVWDSTSTSTSTSIVDERSEHLRQRLFSGGLRMFVQPIIDTRTGDLLKVEALARLQDIDGHIVSPSVFLPFLDDIHLSRLFEEGFKQSLEILSCFEKQDLTTGVSVNMPPAYLLNFEGFKVVKAALSKYNIAADRVTIELLETEGVKQSIQNANLRHYKDIGFDVAIDDFGSGHSSLLRLSTFPFDVLKIDQSVLQNIYETPLQVFSMIRSVLNMSEDFSICVIIEGVENVDMLEAIYYLKGSYVQGYAVAPPMPSEEFVEWYRNYHNNWRSPTRITTPLGALACHWMSARAECVLISLEECPLTQWLKDSGLENEDVFKWHTDFHRGNICANDMQGLTTYLINRVIDSNPRKKG